MEKMYGENGMNKIIIGNKDNNIKYCFRETCFGIVKKNDKFYITSKDGDYSLIGGGLEDGESHLEWDARHCSDHRCQTQSRCTGPDHHFLSSSGPLSLYSAVSRPIIC